MFEGILNTLMLRKSRAEKAWNRFKENIESEITEEFLVLLLKCMRLIFLVNRDFRKNIEGFNGKYLFNTLEGSMTVSVVFKNGKMKIKDKPIDDPNVTLSFRNARSLWGYAFSEKPDILNSLLKQDVVIDGNLNYLFKFFYMSRHLQLFFTGALP